MTVLERAPAIGERFIVPPDQRVRVASVIRAGQVVDTDGGVFNLAACRAVSTTQAALDVLTSLLQGSRPAGVANPLDVVANPTAYARNPVATAVVSPKISQEDLAAAIAQEADEGRLTFAKRQLQNDVARLTREMSGLKAEIEGVKKNLDTLKTERQELGAEIVRLRKEKAAFTNNTNTIRDLTAALRDAQEKLELLRAVSDADNAEAIEPVGDSSPYVDQRRLILEGTNVAHNDD